MEWTSEAEAALRKVPFFIRKKVRARVEDEAREAGKKIVSLSDVRLSQKRYLSKMNDEVKGHQLETCFGGGGCPNRAVDGERVLERLESALERAEIRKFLEKNVGGDLKHHHEFRVAIADCPNACSQPQIKDMGVLGAVEPAAGPNPCISCGACADACKENAVSLKEGDERPAIDLNRCVKCGKCIDACPAGALTAGARGYRVLLGGKLGRHPRLALELPGLFTEDEVLDILRRCIEYYKRKSVQGQRFADLLQEVSEIGF